MKKYATSLSITLLIILLPSVYIIAQPKSAGATYCAGHKLALHESPLTAEDRMVIQASRERSDTFDILEYDILADLTRGASRIFQGTCRVSFAARKDNIDYINLDLAKLEVDSILTDAGTHLSYTHHGYNLKVSLDSILNKNDVTAITVYYQGTPTNSNFGGFYFTPDYYYNLGIGIEDNPHNMGRAWYPCFDNFVERSTYIYRIRTQMDRKGYGLGTFMSEDTIDNKYFERTYHMTQQIPTYLSHISAGNYTTIDRVHQGVYGVVPIQLVVQQKNKSAVQKHFQELEDAISCMEYWYGPYAWERVGYHMTEQGAMEHPTGVAYPISVATSGDNRGLFTHELAHHWWGNLTTLTTDADMWFKEGPSSYAEHQLTQWLDGDEAFEDAVRNNNLNMVATAHIQDGAYLPLSPMPEDITYGVHTYDKGAAMIHNLRAYLGDSLFRKGMQYVLEEKQFSHTDALGFRNLLEESTGVNLENFFENWIFSPGWSDFYIEDFNSEEAGGKFNLSISINQNKYHTPNYHQSVPLMLYCYGENGILERVPVIVSGANTQVTVSLDFEPISVHLNLRNELNLAQSSNEMFFKNNNFITSSYMNINVKYEDFTTIEDKDFVAVTHHLTGPSGEMSNVEGKLSSTHFWNYSNPKNLDNVTARLYYDGSKEGALDYDLFGTGEDSLLLMHQPIGATEWKIYEDYNWAKVNPIDKVGFVFITNPKDGKYALARGESTVAIQKQPLALNHTIYPNPSRDFIFISEDIIADRYEIYNMSGNKVQADILNNLTGQQRLSLSDYPSGIYYISYYDSQQLIGTDKFIVE